MSRIVDTIRQGPPRGEQGERPTATTRGAASPRPAKGSPELGVVQYFHMGDRAAVERALAALDTLPITHLRTSISWCDWTREGGEEWYRWLLPLLTERLTVLPCFLYTPPELGVLPKTSSPPRDPQAYGQFVASVLELYGEQFPYVELWNEPNNYIEWDWTVDPEWKIFAEMIAGAGARAAELGVTSVLGGMSPFDPNWLDLMFKRRALENVEVVGVHGFPGTWEAVWEGWDVHVGRVQEVIDAHRGGQRIWVTEAGYSTWSHDEVGQCKTMVELAAAPAERVYWYSLEDLSPSYDTLDGFHCDERAYHFGLLRHQGAPKLAGRVLAQRGISGMRELVRFSTGTSPRPRDGVLITGGAGFVGTNLADRLASGGMHVTVLDSLARPGVEQNLRWLKHKHRGLVNVEVGDIRDVLAVRRALGNCRRVFHLAAQVAVTTSLEDPREDHDINVQGTINVLEEARKLSSPPAIVFTSTNKVYGSLDAVQLTLDDGRYEPVDELMRTRGVGERTPLDFCSPYGCSKGAADQYVLDYARSFGLPACVFRMSCIYGPHQHGTEDQGWVAHFVRQALRDETITIFGDGHQTRDLLYVEDLVDAVIAASANRQALQGRAFNIGGGRSNAASVLEVTELIGELLGKQPAVSWGPWRVGDQRYYVSDTSAFARLTGWRPRVALAGGLSRLCDWLASEHVPAPATVAAAATR